MSIEETLQGKWCLLVEEEPYSTEGRTLLEFRNGSFVDNDGVESPYRVDGNASLPRTGRDAVAKFIVVNLLPRLWPAHARWRTHCRTHCR